MKGDVFALFAKQHLNGQRGGTVLYNDIIEELQHLEAVDKDCILRDGENGEVDLKCQ